METLPRVVTLDVDSDRIISERTKTPIRPKTDYGVLFVSQTLIPHWEASGYTTELCSIEHFKEIVMNYELKLGESGNSSIERTPTIDRIQELIDMAFVGLKALKNQLQIDFSKSKAIAYYPTIGAKKLNGSYTYQSGYDNMAIGIATTIQGIKKLHYENHKYGLAYFEPIYSEFVELTQLNKSLTGSGSSARRTKNELKTEIDEVLKAILYLLKANKGEAWLAEARKWGFQRERY